MFKMKMLSTAGVMHMDHIILDKVSNWKMWMAVCFGDKYSYEQISEFDKYEVQEE